MSVQLQFPRTKPPPLSLPTSAYLLRRFLTRHLSAEHSAMPEASPLQLPEDIAADRAILPDMDPDK
jgi:hypothetical protein